MRFRSTKYISEFMGTMLFVFFSCGAVITFGADYKKGTAYLISAFAASLAFVAMHYTVSRFSGCHLNPAVSLAMLIAKKIDGWDFLGYTVAQIAGSFAACGLLTAVFWGHTGNYGANTYYNDNPWITILVELILTMTFTLVFLFTNEEKNSGICKGLALLLASVFGIQLTGASLNPAKSLGAAVFAGKDALREYWVFLIAPFLGACFAALIYMALNSSEEYHALIASTSKRTEIGTVNEALTKENTEAEEAENL